MYVERCLLRRSLNALDGTLFVVRILQPIHSIYYIFKSEHFIGVFCIILTHLIRLPGYASLAHSRKSNVTFSIKKYKYISTIKKYKKTRQKVNYLHNIHLDINLIFYFRIDLGVCLYSGVV